MKNFKILFIVIVIAASVGNVSAQLCDPILNCFSMKDTTINTCSGTFQDSDAGGLTMLYSYANNENYTMTICSGTSDHIVINFSQLDIKSGDHLYIHDGPTTGSPQLYDISNQNITLAVISSGTCLTFHFTSDNSGSIFSSNGNWTAEINCASTIHYINDPTTISECNAFFMDDGQSGNYSNNASYVKTFCPTGSYTCLDVDFFSLDIENGADFLYVYDGSTTNGPLVATITGTSASSVNSSNANHCLTFKFTSNGSVTKPGWIARINCQTACPPPCNPNPGAYAANACADAPQICDLNGYCGNTSGSFTEDLPGNMCESCGLFDGTIENNSWLMFLASGTSASFNVYVRDCSSGDGIQMGIYEATNCANFVLKSDINLTGPSGTPSGGTFTITATGLTPGNTYYIMIDGVSGAVCNYTVEAASGVMLGAAITAPLSICEGQSANLVVTPGATSYTWSSTPPDASLAGQVNNSTIHVTPNQTTTYSCVIVSGPSACTTDTTLSTMVTVYAATDPLCSGDYECSIVATATPNAICLGQTSNIVATGNITRDLLANDFNTQTAGVGWANTASAQFNNPCGAGPDSWYLWMGPNADVPRILESNDFDLSTGGIIKFYMRMSIQSDASPCEGPDEPDEGISLQYSTNNGTSWVDFQYFHPNGTILTSNPGTNTPTISGNTPFTVWKQYEFTAPPGAMNNPCRWRWYQSASSTSPYDHWGLDSILITTPPPNVQITWASNPVDPTLSTAPGATNQTVTPTVSTTYIATVSATINGTPFSCSDTVVVSVSNPPVLSVTPIAICSGTCDTLFVSGATSYTWAPATGLSSTTGSSVIACPTQTTTYTVTGTTGGCSSTQTVTVTILSPTDSLCMIFCNTTSVDKTKCTGDPCNYSGPTILINEIMLMPDVLPNGDDVDGSMYGTIDSEPREGEWIELYNPDLCNPIDISCYFLGNNAEDGGILFPQKYPGGFTLPQGTIVPPGGFVMVRGRNAPAVPANLLVQNGGNTIEVIVDSRVCLGGGDRLWFPNAGGWFAFYDQNGVPQDAVSWASSNTLGDAPCNPNSAGCSNVALMNYNSIPANKKTYIFNNAITTPGQSIRRMPDGGAWALNQQAPPTYGTCNSTCIPVSFGTCDGQGIVTTTGGTGQYSYVWDNGENLATAVQLCEGVHYVTVTDVNTHAICIDSVTINNPPLPVFTVNAVNTCPGTNAGSVNVVHQSGASPYVYSWDDSNHSTSQNISGLNAGTFNVTVTGADSCINTGSATVILYPQPIVTVTPPSDSLCLYESVQLTASGADSAYVWAGTSITPTTGATVTVNPVQSFTYSVTGTNTYGCHHDTTVLITVSPLPLVTISSPDDSLCQGESTTLTASGAPYYTWSGPSISPGNNSNPITVTPSSTFVYSVTGQSVAGCVNDTAFMVVVSPNPNITANLSDTAICLGETVSIQGVGSHYYNWSNGITPSSGTNVSFSPTGTGHFIFTVVGYNNTGCDDTTTFAISVYPNPNVYITPAFPEACSGQPVTVTAHGAQTYMWSHNPTPNNLDNATYYPNVSTTYTVTGTSEHGCIGTSSILVNIKPSPIISFTPLPLNGCQPLTVNFQYSSNPGDQCAWNFGDNTSSTETNPVHVFNNPGTYSVTLSVTTGEGCVGTHTENSLILVYAMPDADFITSDSIYYIGSNVEFNSTSANATTWSWNFGEPSTGASNFAFLANTEHLYNLPGTYWIKLVVTSDGSACVDSIIKPIRIVDIQTTNVVTPDGDGKNDYFVLPNVDLVENSHIVIYNRWGRLMYEDYNYKNNWDPKDVADGVYYWVLTMPTGQWFVGNVTVLK